MKYNYKSSELRRPMMRAAMERHKVLKAHVHLIRGLGKVSQGSDMPVES